MDWNPYEDETVTRDGFTLKFIHDPHADGPHEDCEGFIPFVWKSGRNSLQRADKLDDVLDPLAYYSDAQINRHWKAIKNAYAGCTTYNALFREDGVSLDVALDRDVTDKMEYWKEYWGTKSGIAEARREVLSKYLSENREHFDLFAALWSIIKVTAVVGSTCGYSQGDYAEWLAVSVPSFNKRVGTKGDTPEMIESQMQEFGHWLWGDCFGWCVEDADGETVQSCWGYFGNPADADNYGRAEGISALEDAAKRRKAERAARLKELVKNRVPLHARADALASI